MANFWRSTQHVLFLGAILITTYSDIFCSAQANETTPVDVTSSSTLASSTDNVNETTTESIVTPTEERLTEEHQGALDKLRENVLANLTQDYMKTDFYLVRWLEAREWNVEEAEKMLRASLKWREENNLDKIEEENWSDMLEDFSYTKDTRDRLGQPVGTISIDTWNIRAASYAGKMPRMHKYIGKLMEEATLGIFQLQQEGVNASQWTLLMNMDGFGMRMHACTSCLSFYQAFATTYQDYYPGFAKAIVLINAPSTFKVVMQVLRPFFSGKTQKVIRIYGRNEKLWKDYLDLDLDIAEEQRTPEFGGTKADPESKNKISKLYY